MSQSRYIGICRALYAYQARTTEELTIKDGEVFFVLEKGNDCWWRVKRKDDDENDGEVGLVPETFVENLSSIGKTKALYDYEQQTEEEVSFIEGSVLDIYDQDDPDWSFVGHVGWYGFAPSNYLEQFGSNEGTNSSNVLDVKTNFDNLKEDDEPYQAYYATADSRKQNPAMINATNPQVTYNDLANRGSELLSDATANLERYPANKSVQRNVQFQNWEVEDVDAKQRRRKSAIGVGNGQLLISWLDGTTEKIWNITALVTYSAERKHVFIELATHTTSASYHFRAQNKDTAQAIIQAIADEAGAARAAGLREVAAAIGAPLPKLPYNSSLALCNNSLASDSDIGPQDDYCAGIVLFEYNAQGDDELSVQPSQTVEILDSTSSSDWWRCKIGNKEGVIPASYIEKCSTGIKKMRDSRQAHRQSQIVQNNRGSASGVAYNTQQKSSVPPRKFTTSGKPDIKELRTWTDSSGQFKVEAQFLGLSQGEVRLHKTNGVKISVPLSRLSDEDSAFVEDLNKAKDKPEKSEFDWFGFFLSCGVDHSVCNRYSQNFERDEMDETVLPDITSDTLRNLGLKEGDILRVMRHLDTRFKRDKTSGNVTMSSYDQNPRLKTSDSGTKLESYRLKAKNKIFTSSDGSLKNNTRRGRPDRAAVTTDNIDPKFLKRIEPVPVPPPKNAQTVINLKSPDNDAWSPKTSLSNFETTGQAGNLSEKLTATKNPHSALNDLKDIKLLSPEAADALARPTNEKSFRSSDNPPRIPTSEQMNAYISTALAQRLPQMPPMQLPVSSVKTQLTFDNAESIAPITEFGGSISTFPLSQNSSPITGQFSHLSVNNSQNRQGILQQSTGSYPRTALTNEIRPQFTGPIVHSPNTFGTTGPMIPAISTSTPANSNMVAMQNSRHTDTNSTLASQTQQFQLSGSASPTQQYRGTSLSSIEQPPGSFPSSFQMQQPLPSPSHTYATHSTLNLSNLPHANVNAPIKYELPSTINFKSVSFGGNKSTNSPERTARKANLASATPTNPFGF